MCPTVLPFRLLRFLKLPRAGIRLALSNGRRDRASGTARYARASRVLGACRIPHDPPRRALKRCGTRAARKGSHMAVSRHSVVAGQQPVRKMSEAASLAELV